MSTVLENSLINKSLAVYPNFHQEDMPQRNAVFSPLNPDKLTSPEEKILCQEKMAKMSQDNLKVNNPDDKASRWLSFVSFDNENILNRVCKSVVRLLRTRYLSLMPSTNLVRSAHQQAQEYCIT